MKNRIKVINIQISYYHKICLLKSNLRYCIDVECRQALNGFTNGSLTFAQSLWQGVSLNDIILSKPFLITSKKATRFLLVIVFVSNAFYIIPFHTKCFHTKQSYGLEQGIQE